MWTSRCYVRNSGLQNTDDDSKKVVIKNTTKIGVHVDVELYLIYTIHIEKLNKIKEEGEDLALSICYS